MLRGTLFLWLLFTTAPFIGLAIILRGVLRARRERQRWRGITLATVFALVAWTAASYFMLLFCFEVAWALAHTRPIPEGQFPEGATIYAVLGAYASLGIGLIVAISKIPKSQQPNLSRAHPKMLIGLVVCFACVVLSACAEQRHHLYENAEAALSSDEARGQWIPAWLPAGAIDVHLQYDIDTNERWFRFALPPDQRTTFLSHLDAMSQSEISGLRIRSPRSASWWFQGIIDQQPANDGALNAEWFRGGGNQIEPTVVVAFERGTSQTFVFIPPRLSSRS